MSYNRFTDSRKVRTWQLGNPEYAARTALGFYESFASASEGISILCEVDRDHQNNYAAFDDKDALGDCIEAHIQGGANSVRMYLKRQKNRSLTAMAYLDISGNKVIYTATSGSRGEVTRALPSRQAFFIPFIS